MLRLLLVCGFFTVLLTGCVQKSTYNNSGKPVTKSRVNPIEAAKTRIALGLQYLKVGEMSSAKFNLEKAKTFAPKLPGVHTAFAYYFQKVGEDELAEQSYIKALGFDPNDPDALNNYGTFLCKVGRYKEAEIALLKAINVPSYLQVAQSYENAALCAMENKKYEEAKTFFGQSLEHGALRANTLVNIAGLSYAMGDYRDAQKYGQRLSNIGVISPRVLMLRSMTELKLGNITQSKKHGTTLVSMYVKSPQALIYLSKAFENSEFEKLRRIYLKHQYQAFKEQQKEDRQTASSKNKIKKILRPGNNKVQDLPTEQPEPEAVTVTQKPQQQTSAAANEKNTPVTKPKKTLVMTQPRTNKPTRGSMVVAKADAAPIVARQTNEKQQSQPVAKSEPKAKPKPNNINSLQVPFHIAEKGQGMYDISMLYNIKMRRLLKWNKLTEKSTLFIGRKIYISDPNIFHVINEGDTLYGISLKYNILMDKLLQWNDLTPNARLNNGQKILIVNPKRYTL
jgi:type IV pilus assembly protein PilF